jgi:hypothetical protein
MQAASLRMLFFEDERRTLVVCSDQTAKTYHIRRAGEARLTRLGGSK